MATNEMKFSRLRMNFNLAAAILWQPFIGNGSGGQRPENTPLHKNFNLIT